MDLIMMVLFVTTSGDRGFSSKGLGMERGLRYDTDSDCQQTKIRCGKMK